MIDCLLQPEDYNMLTIPGKYIYDKKRSYL